MGCSESWCLSVEVAGFVAARTDCNWNFVRVVAPGSRKLQKGNIAEAAKVQEGSLIAGIVAVQELVGQGTRLYDLGKEVVN